MGHFHCSDKKFESRSSLSQKIVPGLSKSSKHVSDNDFTKTKIHRTIHIFPFQTELQKTIIDLIQLTWSDYEIEKNSKLSVSIQSEIECSERRSSYSYIRIPYHPKNLCTAWSCSRIAFDADWREVVILVVKNTNLRKKSIFLSSIFICEFVVEIPTNFSE